MVVQPKTPVMAAMRLSKEGLHGKVSNTQRTLQHEV
jgi:hypothetical protein